MDSASGADAERVLLVFHFEMPVAEGAVIRDPKIRLADDLG